MSESLVNRWALLCIVAIGLIVLSLFFGAAQLAPSQVITCLTSGCESPIQQTIFWNIRVPRVIVGFLVGAGLAIAGASLQTLTRNSLADPYIFGVVSGAGLGASLAIVGSHFLTFIPNDIVLPLSAFGGALFAVLFVQAIAFKVFGSRTEHILLVGVAASFMFSALSQFVLFSADPFAANSVIFWLLGSVARAENNYALGLFVVVIASYAVLFILGRKMDALLLGEETAASLGVNVPAMRLVLLTVCALLTACIVAYCGGIGFVGLMIPHIVRRWFGVTNRHVLTGCVLLGGGFIVATDILARSMFCEQELPIGIITAAIGSVFFLFALRRPT